jgi:hypothetical protein
MNIENQNSSIRFYSTAEPDTSNMINRNLLAQLTGGDTISLRDLHASVTSQVRFTSDDKHVLNKLSDFIYEQKEQLQENDYLNIMNFLQKVHRKM